MACTDYNPFHEYLSSSDSISKSKVAMDMGPNSANGTKITSLVQSMSNGRFTDKLLQEDIAVENGGDSLFLCNNFHAQDMESGLSCTFSSGTDDFMKKLLSSEKKESNVFRNSFLQHDYPLLEKFQESDDMASSDDSPTEYINSNSFDRFFQPSDRHVNNTPTISGKFSCKSKMSCVNPNDSNSVAWSCFNTNGFLKYKGYFGFSGSDTHSEVPTSAAAIKKRLGRTSFLSNGSDTHFDELASASVMNGRAGNTSSVLSGSPDAVQVSEPHCILGRWSKDRSFANNLMEENDVNEGFDAGNVSLAVGRPWSQRNSNSSYNSTIEMVHPAECGKSSTGIPNPKFGAMNTISSYFFSETKPSSLKNNLRSQWHDLPIPKNCGWNDASSHHNFIPDDASFVHPERCHHGCSHSDQNETSSLTRSLFHELNICSRSDFQDLTLLMWDLLKARGGSHSEGEQTSLNFRQPRNGEGTSCAFCKRNGETLEFYSTHVVKDNRGKVICPILRKYICPLCGSTGDKAHTIRHCPLYSGNPINTAFDAFATKRSSCGRRSRNSSY